MSVWQQELPSNQWLVGVRGRLDQSQAPHLEKTLMDLIDKGNYHLVIDLTEASYINSGGLRCLVTIWRKVRQQEGDLVLCGLNTRLQEIFAMIGFDKVFQIYATCHETQPKTNTK